MADALDDQVYSIDWVKRADDHGYLPFTHQENQTYAFLVWHEMISPFS
jgi:hypothetical protein